MSQDTPLWSTWLDRKALAWMVLGLALVFTMVVWRHFEAERARHERERFVRAAEKQKNLLVGRIQNYEQVLRGGAALFAATGMPSREAWRAYVDTLDLERSLPGILAAGFALMVPSEDRAVHERTVRVEGFSDYAIFPPGERPMLSSIVYIEPFSQRNRRAFGYDMYSEPVRREAMDRARDTGQPALSRKVRLVQEDGVVVQPGFLIYLPVYRADMPRDSVAARRAALLGFVYSPFRSFDLLNEVFRSADQSLEVELFDGAASPENLLYSSAGAARDARQTTEMTFQVAGNLWLARFRSSAHYEAAEGRLQPTMFLVSGLAVDLLLFSVLYINARHRHEMRATATRLAQGLDSYKALVENIPGAVFRCEIGAAMPVRQLSNGIAALTGEGPERFLSGEMSYSALIHPDDRATVAEAIAEAVAKRSAYTVEYRIKASDGFTRWVGERGQVTSDAAGRARWLDGVILDITERKAAEIMIRDLAFNDTLTGLPNRRLLLDRLEHQLAASERTGRYGALLFIDMDNFKTINDTLGHAAGDQVLVEVASRLLASVRESDTVARLGGDEFVVVIGSLGSTAEAAKAEAAELGSKILSKLSQPYRLGAQLRDSTPSIGITTFCGNSVSAGQLLRRADQAMYRAKSAGRHQIKFYGEDPAPGTRGA